MKRLQKPFRGAPCHTNSNSNNSVFVNRPHTRNLGCPVLIVVLDNAERIDSQVSVPIPTGTLHRVLDRLAKGTQGHPLLELSGRRLGQDNRLEPAPAIAETHVQPFLPLRGLVDSDGVVTRAGLSNIYDALGQVGDLGLRALSMLVGSGLAQAFPNP